jgi:hypothetical protein
MENFSNFIYNKEDPVTQHFLKIFPELDNSYKLINKIYIDNKLKIESLIYKILIKETKNINQKENERNIFQSKKPVMIPKYGYLFQYDKFKTKFNYNRGYKCSQAHEGTYRYLYAGLYPSAEGPARHPGSSYRRLF